ncbi:Hydrolase acting on acid anhydrides catalyzing transmembrane movement of substances [Streptococcus thermophilus CNCM I-1630]|nr:Hydrolase acting on acid anhydrides catalyzing transmembrane movement of substances [Streptococcus thermophilus CNCM I-1630]
MAKYWFFGKGRDYLLGPSNSIQGFKKEPLAGQFIEGLPPFVLTFERNIRPVEKHFLRRSLQLAIPNALMLVISVLIFHLSQVYLGMSSTDMLTLSYYMMGSTGVLAVIRACPHDKGACGPDYLLSPWLPNQVLHSSRSECNLHNL